MRRSMLLWLAGAPPALAFTRVRVQLVRLGGVTVESGTALGERLTISGSGGTVSVGRGCFLNAADNGTTDTVA